MEANGSVGGSRVWFVTGASSGFGRAISEAALEAGDRLMATARNLEQVRDLVERHPGRARTVCLDVTKPGEAKAAADAAVGGFGRVDVLVNNAGYGILGAVEEVSDEEARAVFGTNVFGLLNVTRAVLPVMRRQRSGHVFSMSSMGGFVSGASFGIYNASKFAVEGISEALAEEVRPLGIRVTVVEPGLFRTDFAGRSLAHAERSISDYAEAVEAARSFTEEVSGCQPGDPRRAARALVEVSRWDDPPFRLPLGTDALEAIRGKLRNVTEQLERVEDLSRSTGFEPAATGHTDRTPAGKPLRGG